MIFSLLPINKDAEFVAQKAREVFLEIRQLRKTEPQFTRAQKNELERKIKQLKDQWWEGVEPFMRNDKIPPP